MENVIKCEVTDETSREQNSMPILESHSVNTEMEITNTELDLFTVDVEANNQQSVEISPNLEEGEDRAQFLFAPFDHSMRPDPELVRLESEKSALDQEAATKIINDRYKLIMEVSARRKEKEQRDKMKFTQILHNMANDNVLKTTHLSHVDSEDIKETTLLLHNMNITNDNVLETTQFSHYVDSEDIKETTQLLHNMHVAHENVLKATQPSYADSEDLKKTTQLPHNVHPTPSSLTNDQSEEFSESHLEKIFWHSGLNRFIKLNYSEINTTANISGIDMLNAVTEHHQCRVGEALNQMRNEQKEGVKRIAFFQSSRKLGSAKRKKTTQIFQDEFIGSSFEDHLDDRSGSP